jgi:hypothetical protein
MKFPMLELCQFTKNATSNNVMAIKMFKLDEAFSRHPCPLIVSLRASKRFLTSLFEGSQHPKLHWRFIEVSSSFPIRRLQMPHELLHRKNDFSVQYYSGYEFHYLEQGLIWMNL